MKKYAIPGVFAERSLTGVTRYCWEIMEQLDLVLDPEEISLELVLPQGVDIHKSYRNIKTVHYGKKRKFFWLNNTFLRYLKKTGARGLNLGVNVPWRRPDIVCIYDVNSIANPGYFSRYHVIKTKLEKKLAVRRAEKVFTISRFSAGEISEYLGGSPEDYPVVPCGWQHMDRITPSGDSEEKYGLKKGGYFFSLSSMAPTKNFRWVLEAAKKNPKHTFVIAGGTDPRSFGISSLEEEVGNVRYVGRVSDEDAKLLMRDCRAFIFPSYYEGFGIPPVEAFACGAGDVVVSDVPVMHEVCGESAHYIDPFDYDNIDMKKILAQKTEPAKAVLDKYSWKKSAEILYRLLENM